MASSTHAPSLKDVAILVPETGAIDQILSGQDLPPFDDRLISFVAALSRAIMKHPPARQFPEIISLAHWMRPRAIKDLEAEFTATRPANTVALSRGVALHFAPGNVDTIFLYSALLAVLTGNRNIVRVSSRASEQIELLITVLNALLRTPEHAAMADRLLIIRYDHDDAVTAALSGLCDLRIVWGGDETVNTIRTIPLPPRARDVCFPNRWSLAVLSAEALLELNEEGRAQLAVQFANDAYWFGQMACSSPRQIIWVGSEEHCAKAPTVFWPAVQSAAEKFADTIPAVGFVNKLVSQHVAAIEGDISRIVPLSANTVSVGQMTQLTEPDHDLYVGDGFFWDARAPRLEEIASILDSRSQTIASFGISGADWQGLILKTGAHIDRVVPFGQALQFGHIWDGMNLLSEFSRLVSIDI